MEYRRVACERCGGETSFTAQVSPLGNEPGVRIYHCAACTCFTVIEWGGLASRIRSTAESAQLAQQHGQRDDGSP
jgi:hypothetical protein